MNIILSDTVKMKAHRLMTCREVKNRVKNLSGHLFREGGDGNYHLADFENNRNIIFRVNENGDRIVITQSHLHNDPRKSSFLQPVSDIRV